jgi:putative membrane protein
MMGWYDHGNIGTGGWVLMSLMMLVFWGAVIFGGIALWRATRRDANRNTVPEEASRPDAQQLLDERFARGEIQPDDYQRRRELLGSGR